MAWAIFNRECNWGDPKSRFSFNAKASDEPQQLPHEFVDYCVAKGWAVVVPPPTRTEARAIKARKRT